MYKIHRWIGNNVNMEQGLIVEDAKTLMTIVEDLPPNSLVQVADSKHHICSISVKSDCGQQQIDNTVDYLHRQDLPNVHLTQAYFPEDCKIHDDQGREVQGVLSFKLHYDANSNFRTPLIELVLAVKKIYDVEETPGVLQSTITYDWTDDKVTEFANVQSITYLESPPQRDMQEGAFSISITDGYDTFEKFIKV